MVTSSDHLTAVEYATVSVQPQPYYPPQAVAKGDLVIHLPKDSVTIDGSRSKAYEVTSLPHSNAVSLSLTAMLSLSLSLYSIGRMCCRSRNERIWLHACHSLL